MAGKNDNVLEREVISNVAEKWFADFDAKPAIGNIDFTVAVKTNEDCQGELFEKEYFLWAEAKQGTKESIKESFVQLILTIGREKTYDKYLPPPLLGAFDAEKIAFIPYTDVIEVFYQNDFNWNVKPSDHTTKEFKQLYDLMEETLDKGIREYNYDTHGRELKQFIRDNFKVGGVGTSQVRITESNFIYIYQRWLQEVMPSIAVEWDRLKKDRIIAADFYIADVLSKDNESLKESLYVLLKTDHYELGRAIESGLFASSAARFRDNGVAHTQFWNRYRRPPEEQYRDYIIKRRDLLVPQDIRERKGAYYTPEQWVKLSQMYLARVLGENWQEEYYVWDCCGGTGNMVVGLTNKFKVFASTLDMQDVQVMYERVDTGKLNLTKKHIFQFDFLNDDFFDKVEKDGSITKSKLPEALQKILGNKEKRKKLVMYINPPYAEAANAHQGGNVVGVAIDNLTYNKYRGMIGNASNELFAHFLIRMYKEIDGCVIAHFSTLKALLGSNFKQFRSVFKAQLDSLFVVPANTFDNVRGSFPIGFHIWHTDEKVRFEHIKARVYGKDWKQFDVKNFYCPDGRKFINDWYAKFYDNSGEEIGVMNTRGNDFQNQNMIRITSSNNHNHTNIITANNLIQTSIYLAVRQCIPADWLNDRDQFLAPNDTWQSDIEFQDNCLAYTLFHGQNKITSEEGKNYWIPFTEEEVGVEDEFEEHFMSDFIRGKIAIGANDLGLENYKTREKKAIEFSKEAQAVMNAGLELWRYYHEQPKANINASFYDIRKHFQGVGEDGKMNSKSADATYTGLINTLRTCVNVLGEKIASKVYEHRFLMGSADESMR